jgi:hypothetical protein
LIFQHALKQAAAQGKEKGRLLKNTMETDHEIEYKKAFML